MVWMFNPLWGLGGPVHLWSGQENDFHWFLFHGLPFRQAGLKSSLILACQAAPSHLSLWQLLEIRVEGDICLAHTGATNLFYCYGINSAFRSPVSRTKAAVRSCLPVCSLFPQPCQPGGLRPCPTSKPCHAPAELRGAVGSVQGRAPLVNHCRLVKWMWFDIAN